MQYQFSRSFVFPLSADIDLTVSYSGRLLGYLENGGYQYTTDIEAIDVLEINGNKFQARSLDPHIEELLLDRAFEDSYVNFNNIMDDIDMRREGLRND